MLTLMKLLVVGCAAWIYHDATKNKIGRIPGRAGWDNLPAGAWALGSLWLWLIAFPLYLVKRSELIQRAQEHPREAAYVPVKLGIFALLFVGLLLQGLSGGSGTITFAEQVDANLNTVNEGNEFSMGWVHMVIRGDEPFGDSTLTVFVRQSGASAWVPAEQHIVSPEWDTYAAPVLLDAAGSYDVKVETGGGKLVAEDRVYVE
ncbi:MAG: hypothetical protein GC168_14875 [Candidatus Hydrogenedens sp.]|nr:hypothetical protein [Candidatus Hydrogenedens sp.]